MDYLPLFDFIRIMTNSPQTIISETIDLAESKIKTFFFFTYLTNNLIIGRTDALLSSKI